MNSGGSMGFRPGPYDRGDRHGGGGGMNRFQSRGSRSFKGNFSNNSDYNFDNRPWKNNDNMYTPYDIGDWNNGCNRSGGIHCIHMRGLPFKASQMDVADFFKPIIPVNIRLLQDNTGRASGEADVEFACHEDAVRAMSKDKGHMQHRYIELFLNSAPGGSGGGNGGPVSYGGNLGRRRL